MAIQTRHEEREPRRGGGARGDEDRRPPRGGRRRHNPLGAAETVDHKDVPLLKSFISERGKLLPRRITGVTAKQQRRVAQAVKRARQLGLLPYLYLGG